MLTHNENLVAKLDDIKSTIKFQIEKVNSTRNMAQEEIEMIHAHTSLILHKMAGYHFPVPADKVKLCEALKNSKSFEIRNEFYLFFFVALNHPSVLFMSWTVCLTMVCLTV